MANDDRQSQQFIREVDEELRRAQLKAIWDRFSPVIIGACVLVVALTAGYRGWLWWQERQAASAGDRYIAALELMDSDTAAGEAALLEIAEDSGAGYPALARLRLAGEQAAAGEASEAIAAFDAIANDTSVSDSLRSLARLRGALISLDTGDLAGAEERAEPLNVAGGVWRHSAREIIGTAAYEAGDMSGAREQFLAIQQDVETPAEQWIRAGWMVALIDGQLAAPGASTATETEVEDGEAAPAEAAEPMEEVRPEAETPAVAPEASAAPADQPETEPTAPEPEPDTPEPSPAPEAPELAPQESDTEPQAPIPPQ